MTLTVLSIGALAVVQYASETQDVAADITHVDTLSRLGVLKMLEIEQEGLSLSYSDDGEFEDYPGYKWEAQAKALRDGGWCRMVLTVTRTDTKRSVVIEKIFRELL